MKSIIFSGVAIAIVCALVFIGSALTGMKLLGLEESLRAASTEEEYRAIEEEFLSCENFLSLSVGDLELAEMRYSFSELIAFMERGSDDEAAAAKSRLLCYIEHERRLSGFGFEAIF